MYWLVALMTFALAGLILTGVYFELRPAGALPIRPWLKPVSYTHL